MAESESNGILICPICLEKLNNPKYLPCLHTFCEGCIQTHITSVFVKGCNSSSDCPVCRSNFTVSNQNFSPEKWAQQLPVNWLILGLLEKEKMERPDRKCMSCERIGNQTDACIMCVDCSDLLCEICQNCHKANKFTSEHHLRSLSDLTGEEIFPQIFRIKCTEHKSKKLKLFCVDHDTPCCSLCVSIDHRKCNKITSIEDAAQSFLSKNPIDKMEKDLKLYTEDMETIVFHNKNILADLENQYKTKVTTIQETCKELFSQVEEFENKRKNELQKLYEQKKDEIETQIVVMENCLKKIENEKNILIISKEKTPKVQQMLESIKIGKQIENHKQMLKEKSRNGSVNLELTLDNIDDVQKVTSLLETACKTEIRVKTTDLKLKSVPSEITKFKFNRFGTFKKGSWFCSFSTIDAIYFTVSREIKIIGILSFGPETVQSCNVTLTLKKNEDVISETVHDLDKSNEEDGVIDIEFDNYVTLKEGVKYQLMMRVNNDSGVFLSFGQFGRAEVECAGVVFMFEDDPICCKTGTSITTGQLPGFIFTKIKKPKIKMKRLVQQECVNKS